MKIQPTATASLSCDGYFICQRDEADESDDMVRNRRVADERTLQMGEAEEEEKNATYLR